MLELTKALRDALSCSDAELDTALKAHFVFGRGQFYQAVTEICDGLWSQLDQQRDQDMQQARENGAAIDDILGRLERIGKHVRLVSLNASVEAARVGDAGRGLGVIAVEFKSLAEEIQHLAASARDNINGMTKGAG
ncbi:methyl-accepting chemotaxis protein [uncultured Tateyamaria sp.]|uniref:methyl-accepting chemotaxis protein n=1 Tax=Tateyamaria sp. 1078 TaxID=3417464 RepID=UPI00263972E2|nr:methyl-accepting chemotaxis protein [uncultured Tateyamaria sp.]